MPAYLHCNIPNVCCVGWPTVAGVKRSLPDEESAPEPKRHCTEGDFKIGNFYTVKEAYGE